MYEHIILIIPYYLNLLQPSFPLISPMPC